VYTYDAIGNKLKKSTTVSGITTDRYYAGAFEYDNLRRLDLIHNEEGFVEKDGTTYTYEYFLKDHLGNTRAVVFYNGSGVVSTKQVTDFYPFGMTSNMVNNSSDNKYLFNGKELQDDNLGGVKLDWYDYGARFYDAQIGRFTTQDPFADKYYSLSPFSYVANNPLKFIDPDGREIWIGFNVTKTDGTTVAQKVQYKEGKLYAGGKEYSGGNEYATKVLNDLNQLSKDNDQLSSRLETLETSKNIHTIQMTDGPDDGNSNSSSKADVESHKPTGSKTKYNPDKDENIRGDKRVPRAGLAHEILGHGWDADQGKKDYSETDNGIPMYEVNAVNQENRARAAAGDVKKETYAGKSIPAELLDDTHKKK
jgi:RHS repeat-associated protein